VDTQVFVFIGVKKAYDPTPSSQKNYSNQANRAWLNARDDRAREREKHN